MGHSSTLWCTPGDKSCETPCFVWGRITSRQANRAALLIPSWASGMSPCLPWCHWCSIQPARCPGSCGGWWAPHTWSRGLSWSGTWLPHPPAPSGFGFSQPRSTDTNNRAGWHRKVGAFSDLGESQFWCTECQWIPISLQMVVKTFWNGNAQFLLISVTDFLLLLLCQSQTRLKLWKNSQKRLI